MRADAAADTLNLLDEGTVPRVLLEVDEDVGAVGSEKLLLVGARVDAHNPKTDCRGVLNGQVTETATRARDDDKVAGLGVGLLDRLVNGDARTKNGCGDLKRKAFGNGREVASE